MGMLKGGQKKIPTLLIITIVALPHVAGSKDFGINGEIWEIREKNPVEEIQSIYDSKRNEIEAQIAAIRDLKDYSPETKAVTLHRAERKRSFLVDTTFILETEIKDNSGKLIYPAGTKYNLLDYPPFPTKKKYVVFNGENPEEVKYVIKNFGEDPLVVFIASGGIKSWHTSQKKLGTGVKILTEDLSKVFHLSKSISVIHQNGGNLQVDEIPVPMPRGQTNN